MKMRFATSDEIKQWDEIIVENPDSGNIFQGAIFAELKTLHNWQPRYILSDTCGLVALEKSIPGLGKYWYIPKGPGVKTLDELQTIVPELTSFAHAHRVFGIKIEPELAKSDSVDTTAAALGLVHSMPVQPNHSTVVLDISKKLDDVMAGLNQKGRHAIRRAQRDGVTTAAVDATDENCHTMYNLLAGTAAGQFTIRPYEYYENYWKTYAAAGRGQLFFAYFEGKVVASAFAVFLGRKGTYKDGASVRERTAYGASHALQWQIIQWMKSNGVTSYDLCGAPPSDRINDPTHPHYGIGRFKTSFSKTVTDYVGAYDIVVNQQKFTLFKRLYYPAIARLYRRFFGQSWY